MGSIIKLASGVGAAMLIQAGMAAPAVAETQTVESVRCGTAQLINAITAANNTGGRILKLTEKCTYVLTAVAEVGVGPDGLPIIRGNITLVGESSTRIVRAATAPQFRLLEVAPGGALGVRGITLSGGSSTGTGGAIRNSGGTVTLFETTVSGNRAQTLGGGLDNVNPGHMLINSSLISGNTAATVNGGGVFDDGALSVSFSRFVGNTATAGAGGGLRVTGANGRADVFRTTFERNMAGTTGGGISVGANSGLTLTGSQIERNRAMGNGGGVFVDPGGIFTQSGNTIRKNDPNDCVGVGCT